MLQDNEAPASCSISRVQRLLVLDVFSLLLLSFHFRSNRSPRRSATSSAPPLAALRPLSSADLFTTRRCGFAAPFLSSFLKLLFTLWLGTNRSLESVRGCSSRRGPRMRRSSSARLSSFPLLSLPAKCKDVLGRRSAPTFPHREPSLSGAAAAAAAASAGRVSFGNLSGLWESGDGASVGADAKSHRGSNASSDRFQRGT